MHWRKILDRCFGLIVAGLAAYGLLNAFFPRFHNDWSCESSKPETAAQIAGFADARSQKAASCTASQKRCQFLIHDNFDGTFRVSLNFVREDFFEGCVIESQDMEVFVYNREGRLVGIEEPPYG